MSPPTDKSKYLGYRSDLRKDKELPSRKEIERVALSMAKMDIEPDVKVEQGVTAYELSEALNISKEWARRILKGLEDKGKLTKIKIGQLYLYKIK